jgi:hypothetical protein
LCRGLVIANQLVDIVLGICFSMRRPQYTHRQRIASAERGPMKVISSLRTNQLGVRLKFLLNLKPLDTLSISPNNRSYLLSSVEREENSQSALVSDAGELAYCNI